MHSILSPIIFSIFAYQHISKSATKFQYNTNFCHWKYVWVLHFPLIENDFAVYFPVLQGSNSPPLDKVRFFVLEMIRTYVIVAN